jgi:2-C-methyl-D-erythritol 2,4-cyclodiphosphate synthase
MSFRIGFGFDVHQLKVGLDFWLGGIIVPHTRGGLGHSDADVLIHTICDALLGAANLGDIGKHFPDTAAEYKGIDSKILLKEVMVLIRNKGYEIGNIDSTICLQTPKIGPYIPEMKKVLATCMNIDVDQVSIKATTTEKLSFVGREEGVSAYATVLITKI